MWSAHYRLISMVVIFKISQQNHIVYGIKGLTFQLAKWFRQVSVKLMTRSIEDGSQIIVTSLTEDY